MIEQRLAEVLALRKGGSEELVTRVKHMQQARGRGRMLAAAPEGGAGAAAVWLHLQSLHMSERLWVSLQGWRPPARA